MLAAAVLLAGAAALLGAAPPRGPRTAEQIAKSMAGGPHALDCETCHSQHGEGQPEPYARALVGPDDNTLCDRCHTTLWQGGSYAGTMVYGGSAHGGGAGTIWPGPDPPARTDANAAGKCLNCHDPHGWQDAAGEVPHLLVAREENLCFTCHDGSPAMSNVRVDLQKPYRHPTIDYADRHSGPLESLPEDFGISPLNKRHAECEDCHNPHVARGDRMAPTAPDASKRLLGTSRLRIVNGPAGTAPGYFFTAGADTTSTPVTEYQLCFKCHSSWTTLPAGQLDLAKALNPNNPSYHPVEAQGRDLSLSVLSFVPGWQPSSVLRCGDCHGSESGLAAGPHGSMYPAILKRPYAASAAPRAMTSDEICFTCHSYDTYGNPSAPELSRSASRFNAPGVANGHAEHVGAGLVSCYSCHETHGSSQYPHLIAVGRAPGIVAYLETPTGGTCTPTCHSSKTYTINYAR